MNEISTAMKNMKLTRKAKRNGMAAVEFAMTFPLLMLFVFGSMEFSRANTLRNMCENAALEGARAGMIPGASAQDCADAANNLLDIMGIQNATVDVTPDVITPSTPDVEVRVTIPLSENCLPLSKFVLGMTMEQMAKLPREVTE